LAGGCL